MHLPDSGQTENALGLPAAELAQRKVCGAGVGGCEVGCAQKFGGLFLRTPRRLSSSTLLLRATTTRTRTTWQSASLAFPASANHYPLPPMRYAPPLRYALPSSPLSSSETTPSSSRALRRGAGRWRPPGSARPLPLPPSLACAAVSAPPLPAPRCPNDDATAATPADSADKLVRAG